MYLDIKADSASVHPLESHVEMSYLIEAELFVEKKYHLNSLMAISFKKRQRIKCDVKKNHNLY